VRWNPQLSVTTRRSVVTTSPLERSSLAGGVYIAGGIAPKIIAKLKDGTFMRVF